ncbi:hypothetical protein GDO81_021801 [Engystomops pustulosus]|uniref:EGF-like calcium-binding domain-containing protein n=1 Tax=Engystomops pustulosus TaxID=76066 RepID=A0AAV6ZT91_ENGPU|nr:hypothetical protein GDO81_021801 [Engystomops pustulosus]
MKRRRVGRREHADPFMEELNPGDASEPEGRGTGGAVTDYDGDGMLDLILSHGESMAQPLSVFKGKQGLKNHWLRVIPRTKYGAFARGAKVVLYTKKSGAHLRIIDGGSGYLCEMEPVAHFGLDTDECIQFPFVCPREKPICINTYGGYKCRPNRRCNRGFEPNEDGTACVAVAQDST